MVTDKLSKIIPYARDYECWVAVTAPLSLRPCPCIWRRNKCPGVSVWRGRAPAGYCRLSPLSLVFVCYCVSGTAAAPATAGADSFYLQTLESFK